MLPRNVYNLLSLGFSELSDRWGIKLVARTCKTNKEPIALCRPPLRFLSQTEKSGEKVRRFISKVFESLPITIPSFFKKEEDGQLFMESG